MPRTNRGNYRPITLLRTIFKLWERLLCNILTTETKGHYPPPNQFGSVAGTSAHLALLALRALLRRAASFNLPIYTTQIDLNKAYNRVNRGLLWAILLAMGISTTLIKAIESTYTHCQEQIRIGGYTSTPYSLLSGLRQGSVLSPILFVLYTSSLLDQLNNAPHGVPISSDIFDLICALMFVDDLFTISTTLLGTTTHQDIVTNWALKHHAVLNF